MNTVQVARVLTAQETLGTSYPVVDFTQLTDDGKKIGWTETLEQWGRERAKLVVVPAHEIMTFITPGSDVMLSDGRRVSAAYSEWLVGVHDAEIPGDDERFIALMALTHTFNRVYSAWIELKAMFDDGRLSEARDTFFSMTKAEQEFLVQVASELASQLGGADG